jgi:hypothetical protein
VRFALLRNVGDLGWFRAISRGVDNFSGSLSRRAGPTASNELVTRLVSLVKISLLVTGLGYEVVTGPKAA